MRAWRPQRRSKKVYGTIGLLLLFLWLGYAGLSSHRTADRLLQGETIKIKLYDTKDHQLVELGLEAYVVGVVAAEMPASFPLEALKAQAVAARTYALRRVEVPDPRIKKLHPQADLCSDPSLNQAWLGAREMHEKWGALYYPIYLRKICEAVEATRGGVLSYDGKLIDPVYHSSCGGAGTENSEDVWKYEIPYLRSVPCTPHPDRYQHSIQTISLKTIDSALGSKLSVIPATKITSAAEGLHVLERSATGRIKVLDIGGQVLSGVELRSKLNLPSTHLQWDVSGSSMRFTSRGYGHGVGLCQYGAAAFAKQGWDYKKILTYYYTGVKLSRCVIKS